MKKITDRIDNLSTMKESQFKSTPPIPIAVKIELTARCNFSCWFCGTRKNLRKKSDMDFDLYKKIVKDIYECGVQELGLFYLGESTLYPKLIEALRYAKDIGFKYVFLTTNGYHLPEKLVYELFLNGLDSLKFSFNYFNEYTCLMATRVNAYNTIIENIKKAFNIREKYTFNCGIYASSIEYNKNARNEMQEAINNILPYIDEHYWLPLYNQGGNIIKECENKTIVGNNVARSDESNHCPVCWGLFSKTNITHDGLVSACCFDHKGEFIMGDMNVQTFKECWYSNKFKQLRTKHINGNICDLPCYKCLHKEYRGGRDDTGAHFVL